MQHWKSQCNKIGLVFVATLCVLYTVYAEQKQKPLACFRTFVDVDDGDDDDDAKFVTV